MWGSRRVRPRCTHRPPAPPPFPSIPPKEKNDFELMLKSAARRGNQCAELDPLVLRMPAKFADVELEAAAEAAVEPAAETAAEAAAAVEIELAVPGGAAPAGQRVAGSKYVKVGPWG